MFYVYILLSLKDNNFYVGSTSDLEKRLKYHKEGCVTSTKSRRPLVLLGYEAYQTRTEAIIREKYLKSSDARKEFRKRFKKTLNMYN